MKEEQKIRQIKKKEQKNGSHWKNRFFNAVFVLTLLGSCVLFFVFADLIPPRTIHAGPGLFLFLATGLLLLMVNILYFAWQILLAAQYRPFTVPDEKDLPSCAIIVPAFNEGQQIALTLQSILKSHYPPEKLEIICVNDGSSDDTWYWMQKTAEESKGRITALNLPRNAGKRNALYKGFSMASSEILITIDSDSIVTPETIRQIAAPFAADPTIGGVAGNIRVLNLQEGIIPKMLDVSFVFGFEFLRSAQSIVRSVLCMPGALSAYRRHAVMPHMNEWVNEKFLGKPANIGEDRAITNILMREGYGVVYQNSSVVYTKMPTDYRGLCKMLIRWGRSNVRENLNMMKFAFRKFDWQDPDWTGMQCNLIIQTFWMVAPAIFLLYSSYCIYDDCLRYILGVSVAVIFWAALPAFVYARRYNKRDSLWAYAYGFFSFFTLFWVSPYCVFTVHRSGWLTRKNPEPKKDGQDPLVLSSQTLEETSEFSS